MQKLSIGGLSLLVLFLAAANVRLKRQARLLEERLEAVERPSGRSSTQTPPEDSSSAAETRAAASNAALPPTPPPSTAAVPGKIHVPPAAAPAAEPLQLAGKSVTFTLDGNNVATVVRVGSDDDLRLTEVQKKLVADLRKNCELQTAAYSDLIQRIDAQTEQSIRQLLSPEQLAKYTAQHPGPDATFAQDPVEEPKTASGLRQGYLGISGGDAEGGGARVTAVLPNTAAAAFGIQKDDVILSVNGQVVPHLSGLSDLIKETGEGLPVVLRIRRGANEFTQSLQLGALPK